MSDQFLVTRIKLVYRLTYLLIYFTQPLDTKVTSAISEQDQKPNKVKGRHLQG